MPDSPLSASAYEVLGVQASASESELKRAFRRALRETHPDTGGDPARFAAVQDAWERVGTPEKRRSYDARSGTHSRARVLHHFRHGPPRLRAKILAPAPALMDTRADGVENVFSTACASG